MIRRFNAPAKIPPAPPKAGHIAFRPVQVGSPAQSLGPPSKPQRRKPKPAATQFFVDHQPANTLSNVAVKFSVSEEYDQQSGEAEVSSPGLYENIPRKDVDYEDVDEYCREDDKPNQHLEAENRPATGYENIPKISSLPTLPNIGTFDNFVINKMNHDSMTSESFKQGTYEVPLELDSRSNTEQSSLGIPDTTSKMVSRSAPSSPALTERRPALACPEYRDPASLFDASQLERFASHCQDPRYAFQDHRNTVHHPLQDSGSECTTIRDSGSEFTPQGSFDSTFDDFLAKRRNENNKPKPRAISDIVIPDFLSRNSDETGMFEMFAKSVFGGSINPPSPSTGPPARPRSTFYVSAENEDEAIYHSMESLPGPRTAGGSVFYTEEHIYSSPDTLGPQVYPAVSVENLGYRNSKVREMEQRDGSIPVKTHRSQSVLSEDSFHSLDSGWDTVEDHTPLTPEIHSIYHPEEPPAPSSTKKRLSRVSQMRKKGDSVPAVVMRDHPVAGRAKQIVSMQFSSDILEINHRTGSPGTP